MSFQFVQQGTISLADGANGIGMSVEEFKKEMMNAGYKIPTKI